VKRRFFLLLTVVLLFPLTAWSQLYFPRLVNPTELSTTGYALVNPSDVHAIANFVFFTVEGIPLSFTSQVIPPGGQFAKLGSELFAAAIAPGWVQVTSNVPLQAFWLGGDFATFADGGAAATASLEQVFPLVIAQTEINIANGVGTSNTVTIRVRDNNGVDLAAPVNRALAGNGGFQSQVSALFPGVDLTQARHIRVTGTAPFAGTSVTRGFIVGVESAVLNGVDATSTLTTLNFPHAVSGAVGNVNYTTAIGVTNLSPNAQTITLTFHPEPTGAPISVQRSLSPAGSVRATAQVFFGLSAAFQDGWVEVSGTAPITGFVAYVEMVSGGLAVVPVQTVPQSTMVFAHIAGLPVWYSGVALLNRSTTDAAVEIFTMTPAGELIGGAENVPTASLTLAAGHKTARLLSEFVPPTIAQNGGFVFVRTTNGVPLYGMELFGSINSRILANVAASGVPNGIVYAPPSAAPGTGAPAIKSQPVNTNATGGQQVTFSVSATGAPPLTYQWKKNGADIVGATSARYTTPAVTAGDNGAVYTVVVSNGQGTATSTPTILAVVTGFQIPTLTAQPAAIVSVNAGGNAEFFVRATGITPTYQWRKNGVNIPGATTATFVTPAVTAVDDRSIYSAMVCNPSGCRTTSNSTLQVVAPSVSPVVQVIAGNNHSIAIRQDGTIWGWGVGSNGTIGMARPQVYPNQGAPSAMVDPGDLPFKDVTAAAAAFSHSLMLRANGTVWGTGTNSAGELGLNLNAEQYSFAMTLTEPGVPFINVKTIGAGGGTSYAITNDGSAWAWGNNTYRQIGDGTATQRLVPTRVTDAQGNPFRNVIAVAASLIHAVWLKDDGTVWAVGANTNGTIGDGTNTDRANPVRVETSAGVPLSGITAIAAGVSHTVALKSDGTAYVWGTGLTNRPAPVVDAGGVPLTGISAVAAGDRTTFFLMSNRTVMAFGMNGFGQLGDGSTSQRTAAGRVLNSNGSPFSEVQAISADARHVLALKTDGSVWAWGDNSSRQLGDGTTTARSNPVRVQGLAP